MPLRTPLSRSSHTAAALAFATILSPAAAQQAEDSGSAWIAKVAAEVGSYGDLRAKRDVQYTFTYRDNASGTSDVSTERYLFDGELSWAKYTTHGKLVFPGEAATPIQGWDGKQAWATLDGRPVQDPEALGLAKFLRKTNFYLFAMMQKLQDPGTVLAHQGTREYNGVTYQLVELSFDVPEGVPSDIYLLYINPETHLVGRFLLTVADFGLFDNPLLMEVEYETFGDVTLPVTRRYTQSNWDGEVASDAVWTDEIMRDITFGSGFTAADFDAPAE